LTAWQILNEKAGIKPGDKVLVHAAAGGVGHFAVQMAKYLGAYVVGTASCNNKDFVLSLGASEHIDYEVQRFEDVLNNIDFVLDTIGGEYTDRSMSVLKPGGTIFCIPSGACENISEKAQAKGLHGYTFSVHSNGEHMKEISDFLRKGIVKPFISKRYSFNDIQSAHLQIETRKTKGKVVVVL
jgi:NADPH:quinone reductase-like Zn-dependent oxidoreductase